MTLNKGVNMRSELVPLPDLVTMGFPGNPKDHDIGAIIVSLQTFGFIDPIIINEPTKHILSGHGRMQALVEMREPPQGVDTMGEVWLVPCDYVNLPEEQEAAAVVALNRTVELGGWDELALTKMLAEIEKESDELLQATGYDADELDALIAGFEYAEDDEWADAFDGVPEGDRAPFQQMKFILHDEQIEIVKAAISNSVKIGEFDTSLNENRNGNALSRICTIFLEGHDER